MTCGIAGLIIALCGIGITPTHDSCKRELLACMAKVSASSGNVAFAESHCSMETLRRRAAKKVLRKRKRKR